MHLSSVLYAVFKCPQWTLSIELFLWKVSFLFSLSSTALWLHIKFQKGDSMLKLRIQGTKNDIRWFIRILQADKRYSVENTSTFFDNFGTKKYKRVYTEIFRNKDK